MVGAFFNARAGVHTATGRLEAIWADALRAKALCPDIPSIQRHFEAISKKRSDRNLRRIPGDDFPSAATDPFVREGLLRTIKAKERK